MSQPIIGRIEQLTFSSVPFNQKSPDDSRRDFFKRQGEFNDNLLKGLVNLEEHFDEALKVIDHNFRTLSAQVAKLQALNSATSNTANVELSRADHEEFERLVKPLVEFLQTQHNKCTPHSWIIVRPDGAAFMSESSWFPFKVPD